MRRAKLDPRRVTNIIITATMTNPEETRTPADILADRLSKGFLCVGYHYYVTKTARVDFGVPIEESAAFAPRYGHNSVVLLIEGNGTYSPEQLTTLRRLISLAKSQYPNAQVRLHSDLFRGTNPGLTFEELTDEETKPTNDPS